MDIELLKTFLEVKQTRHFSKAAENLYLTQAAVSARIKQLESILGAPLFSRYRNNLQLTASGERFVHHAEGILIAWDRARQEVSLKKDQQHVISLGATSGLWDLVLQAGLNEIHRVMANLALRAEALNEEALLRRLMERTLDLALIYEPAKMSELKSTPVSSAELILVTTEQHGDVQNAIDGGYISVDWGTSFNLTFAQCFPDAPPPMLHTTLARIGLDFMLDHHGSAYLPLRLVTEHLDQHRLFHLDQAPVIQRPIFACYHQANEYQHEIIQMIEIIRDIAAPSTTDLARFSTMPDNDGH